MHARLCAQPISSGLKIPPAQADAFKEHGSVIFSAGAVVIRCLWPSLKEEWPDFLLALLDSVKSVATIDLIASGEEFRGCGVAQSLIAAFGNPQSVQELRVGTQGTNVNSQRTYEKMGFSLNRIQPSISLPPRLGSVGKPAVHLEAQ